MKQILPSSLIPFDLLADDACLGVDVVYAQPQHPENIFGQIYHQSARMWGHIDMVVLVALAARSLRKTEGWTLIVKDCLRPVEAQQKILMTPPVVQHPEWLDQGGFLSSPGQGGHPRGMAVDLAARDRHGIDVDFGTPFDAFAVSSEAQHNPAHRHYPSIKDKVRDNRAKLDTAMLNAADRMGRALVLLSTEWWDFRFPAAETNQFAPISEADLDPWQYMVRENTAVMPKDREQQSRLEVMNRLKELGDL